MAEAAFKAYLQDLSWPWHPSKIGEYTQLAGQKEFADIEVRGDNADRFFVGSETMIRWSDQPSIVPLPERIPRTDQQAFRSCVIE